MREKELFIPDHSAEQPKKVVDRDRIHEILNNTDDFRTQRRYDRQRQRFMLRGRLRNALS